RRRPLHRPRAYCQRDLLARLQPRLSPLLLLQPDLRVPLSARRKPPESADSCGRANEEGQRNRQPMIRAVVFDFDGVIANSEPLHFRAYRDVLAARGIALTEAAYYENYLGYDDVGAFRAIATDN